METDTVSAWGSEQFGPELDELRRSPRAKDRVLSAIFDRQSDFGKRMDSIESNTEHLSRAIHGDEKNKQPGLLDLTHRNHARIKRLEKLVAYGTGAIATASLFFDQIKAAIWPKH